MTTTDPSPTAPPPRLDRFLAPVLIVVAAAIAYAGSFSGVFLFDDYGRIVENEHIRHLWPPGPYLSTRRPLVEFSFALNYAFGQLRPWGYHLVNLVIHIGAALLLFGIIRRTMWLKGDPSRTRSATWLACVSAMLWVTHPLTTQSVTYLIQRGESLMGLLYLGCVYTWLRGARSDRPWRWYTLTIMACAAGMAAKAVMVTAPVVLLAFDRMFLARSWKKLFRQRAAWYAALVLTWSVLAMCGVAQAVLQSGAKPGANVGFAYHGISPIEYAMTQPGVILHYLRLCVWPDTLCLDYQWPVATSAGQIAGPALIVLALLVATVGAIASRHWLGFAGLWFFLILAPTSSIVPIKDVIFEHRMYLPLAAVTTVVVFVAYALLQHLGRFFSLRGGARCALAILLSITAVIPLGLRTIARNRDYQSPVAMWRSVVEARPQSDRAHFGLGVALYREGRLDAALASLHRAIDLTPRYADAHFNLAVVYTARGDLESALASYRRAVALAPGRESYPKALVDLLVYLKRVAAAKTVLHETLKHNPKSNWARQRLNELESSPIR